MYKNTPTEYIWSFTKGASIYDVRTEGGRKEEDVVRGVSPKEDVVREVA